MHLHDRWRSIVDNLAVDRVTSVDELCEKLSVSPATIRRDLAQLDRMGRLRRIRGGALPVNAIVLDDSGKPDAFHERLEGQMVFTETHIDHYDAKRAIGKEAVKLCRSGESLIIDGGTTTFLMADQMPDEPFHILTTSLPILNRLITKQKIRITLPGGMLFREQAIVLNPYEDGILDNFVASRIFIGAQAISRHGLKQTDPLLVQNERRLLERAEQIVVLVDSSKLNADASLTVCRLNEIDTLVTDAGISDKQRQMLLDAGINLIIAD